MNPQNYWDHEPRQRALMSRADVQAFIDFELMNQGVLKVEAPILRPITPVEIPTSTYYLVKTGYTEVACFKTMEEAEVILRAKPIKRDYSYEVGAKVYYAHTDDTDLTVEPVQLASKADYMNAVTAMKANKAAEDANAKAEQEFRDAAKAMDAATADLFSDWEDQIATERKAQKIKGTWVKYLDLAEGNPSIATAFLLKVFTPDEILGATEWLDPGFGTPTPVFDKTLDVSASDILF